MTGGRILGPPEGSLRQDSELPTDPWLQNSLCHTKGDPAKYENKLPTKYFKPQSTKAPQHSPASLSADTSLKG